MNNQPLSHLKILDLSRLFPGPYATQMLSDLGAKVIKVEAPGEGDYMRFMEPMVDGVSLFFENLNRNKESLCLDLKRPEGVETLLRLAEKCDVLVESFRPGVMERLGVGFDRLAMRNPKLIYCTITGYGTEGPLAKDAGHDLNYIAVSGLLSLIRDRGGRPVIPGFQIADVGGGALHAVIGILAALAGLEATGRGRRVDISMTDSLAPWLVYPWSEYQAGVKSKETGVLAGRFPCYNVYRCLDGKYLAVGALEAKFWSALCTKLGVERYIDLQFAGEPVRSEIFSALEGIFGSRTRDEWVAELKSCDCCATPVVELDEVADHPHWKARKLLMPDFPGAFAPGALAPALTLGGEAGQERAPELGRNTREVLERFGFDAEEIARLREAGALG